MDVDNSTVAILVQSGAVGLALAGIGGLIYALRMAFNHLSHVGEQLGKITAALDDISDKLDKVTRNS